MTPTARSMAYLRAEGWLPWKVEYWGAFDHKRHDLYGCYDIVAVRPGEVAFIQVTMASNISARVRKIANHENTPKLREANVITLLVHGWRKVKGRWQVRVVDVS